MTHRTMSGRYTTELYLATYDTMIHTVIYNDKINKQINKQTNFHTFQCQSHGLVSVDTPERLVDVPVTRSLIWAK